MTFVINERMPYSHSHRVAWPRPKTGDSVLLTFDFRSSRRGGRHHVRLEYQLPIRSENGTTSRSYSVIQLKVTHYYRSRLNTIRPPTPPARRSLRPSDRTVLLVPVHLFKSTIAADRCWIAISIFYLSTHTCTDTPWETHTCDDTSADVYPVQHCCTYTRTRVCILPVCFLITLATYGAIIVTNYSITCTDSRDFICNMILTLFVLCVFCNY